MPTQRRSCKNKPDSFCYIRGKLILKKYRRTLTANVKCLYYAYFGWAVGNQNKVWAPHYCCLDCNHKNKKSSVYPNLASAIHPVPHSVDLPVPIPPADLPVVRNRMKVLRIQAPTLTLV